MMYHLGTRTSEVLELSHFVMDLSHSSTTSCIASM